VRAKGKVPASASALTSITERDFKMTKADLRVSTPPLIASSNNPPDPILQAIEAHKAAYAAYSVALDRASDEEIDALGDAEVEAAWVLVNVHPATRDGTLELLEYTASRRGWPDEDWHTGLLENLAAAINGFFGRTV
jgi:hypothetical protein